MFYFSFLLFIFHLSPLFPKLLIKAFTQVKLFNLIIIGVSDCCRTLTFPEPFVAKIKLFNNALVVHLTASIFFLSISGKLLMNDIATAWSNDIPSSLHCWPRFFFHAFYLFIFDKLGLPDNNWTQFSYLKNWPCPITWDTIWYFPLCKLKVNPGRQQVDLRPSFCKF